MNKRIALLIFLVAVLFLSIGSLQASDVNQTDSNTTLQLEGGGFSDNLSVPMDGDFLKDTVKNQTEVSEVTNNVYYRGSYSVTLKDSNSGKTIPNKKVNFIINNVNYAAVSDSNGVASVALSLNPGLYSASAYFAGDSTYQPSNNFASTINVMSTVKAYDMTKYYKANAPYAATFFDSQGNVLANRDVVIAVSGKPYVVKTNDEGIASLAIDLHPGSYNVVSIDPVTGYQQTNTLKILSTISSEDLSKVRGDGKKFVAQFFKSDGNPLAKQYVKIKIKGKIRKVKTNSKGQLVLSLKKFRKGTYKVVLFNKDGLTKTNTIKIYRIASTKLITDFYTFLPNDDKQIKVRLLTSLGGNSNAGKVIKIRMAGKTYSKRTDGNGEVYLQAPLKKGLYNVEYKFKGNRFFKSSNAKNMVTVLDSAVPKLTVKSTTSFGYGAGTHFKVALTAGGVPLAKRFMTFTLGFKSYSAVTDNNGIASIPVNLNIGTYTANYKTYDQFKVNGTSGSCPITVFKRDASKLLWKCKSSYKDSSQTFKVLLTGADGKSVSNQFVELTLDGETHTGKTASNGYVKIRTDVAIGKYKVSVKFDGSNEYLSGHASKSINVKLSKFGRGINEKNAVYSGAYLKSSSHCQVNSAKIKHLVKSLTKGKHNRIDKAKAIYNFVRDKVIYKNYFNTRKGAVGTLNVKKGNCVDQAHLLVAMYRAAGFKARYVHGKCTFSDGRFGHVWTQVGIGKTWVCGDPTNQRNALGKIRSWNTHSYKFHNKHSSLPF